MRHSSVDRSISLQQQTGQAAVLPLILLAAMILVMYYLYNSGQITTNKIRLQNAADAAMYTLASFQSRDLNFKAYTNRAMVASHVSIAQMVGLSSWMRMTDQITKNATIAAGIPFIGFIFAPIAALSPVTSAASQLTDQLTSVAIMLNNIMVKTLSTSQLVFSVFVGLSAVDAAAGSVEVNDPEIEWFNIAFNLDKQIKRYTEDYIRVENSNNPSNPGLGDPCENKDDSGIYCERLGEFREVTQDSRDSFSASRTYDWFNVGLLGIDIRLHKAGGTEFSEDFKTISAIDTIDLEVDFSKLMNKLGIDDVDMPLGWGASFTNDGSSAFVDSINCLDTKDDDRWGNTWKDNNFASNMAVCYGDIISNGAHTALTESYDGLQQFYDLRDEGYVDTATPIYSVFSKPFAPTSGSKAGESIRTTNMKKDQDTLLGIEEMDIKNGGDAHFRGDDRPGLTTLAKGESYFARPRDIWRRRDGRVEHGNLYNPFWQPRLVEPTKAERRFTLIASEE